jgi:hypothetical protein
VNSPGFERFFIGATGHKPFDYQRRLAGSDSGTTSRSQLINIPTGLGKTAAVLSHGFGTAPTLILRDHADSFIARRYGRFST